MTSVLLGAMVGILIFGLGKIYNRIDDIGKLLESINKSDYSQIIERLNTIEGYLLEIENKL